MRKISIGPTFADFTNNIVNTINDWFNAATARFNIQTLTGNPATGDVPKNQWGFWKNTTSNTIRLFVNDEGTLKSATLLNIIPTVSAQHTVSQALVSGVLTKITFGSEVVDSANYYDTTTSRFTPLIAGDYWVRTSVMLNYGGGPAGVSPLSVYLFKNAGVCAETDITVTATPTLQTISVDALVPMNGSTDFIEVFCNQGSGVNKSTVTATGATTFHAFLVRAT